jgi:hypothetical protein
VVTECVMIPGCTFVLRKGEMQGNDSNVASYLTLEFLYVNIDILIMLLFMNDETI